MTSPSRPPRTRARARQSRPSPPRRNPLTRRLSSSRATTTISSSSSSSTTSSTSSPSSSPSVSPSPSFTSIPLQRQSSSSLTRSRASTPEATSRRSSLPPITTLSSSSSSSSSSSTTTSSSPNLSPTTTTTSSSFLSNVLRPMDEEPLMKSSPTATMEYPYRRSSLPGTIRSMELDATNSPPPPSPSIPHTDPIDPDISLLSTTTTSSTLLEGDQPHHALRAWRHHALEQGSYGTAAFWGEKALCLTQDPNDRYWLAKVYYLDRQYHRAIHLLHSTPRPLPDYLPLRLLLARCYLALKEWSSALDEVGSDNPFTLTQDRDQEFRHIIHPPAILADLRAQAYYGMAEDVRAGECWVEALRLDVRLHDAFASLHRYHLLTKVQQHHLVNSLPYEKQLGETMGGMVRDLHRVMLSQFAGEDQGITKALANLQASPLEAQDPSPSPSSSPSPGWGLKESADVLGARAQWLYTQSRYHECHRLTQKTIHTHPFHPLIRLIHIDVLYVLGLYNHLFQEAQMMIKSDPSSHLAWYAIGSYYLLLGNPTPGNGEPVNRDRYEDARRAFIRSTELDPSFTPGYLGTGHALVQDGDFEQATSVFLQVSAEAPACHEGPMYAGIQLNRQNSPSLALDNLKNALSICPYDPMVECEIGVTYYYKERWDDALKHLKKAFTLAHPRSLQPVTCIPFRSVILCNMAHVYRKQGEFLQARNCFEEGRVGKSDDCTFHVSLGYIYHVMGNYEKAIQCYHHALNLDQHLSDAHDLLEKAMEDASKAPVDWSMFRLNPLSSDEEEEGEGEEEEEEEEVVMEEERDKIEEEGKESIPGTPKRVNPVPREPPRLHRAESLLVQAPDHPGQHPFVELLTPEQRDQIGSSADMTTLLFEESETTQGLSLPSSSSSRARGARAPLTSATRVRSEQAALSNPWYRFRRYRFRSDDPRNGMPQRIHAGHLRWPYYEDEERDGRRGGS
ncbi:MAG: hypothetical protein DHS80DRAFT_22837 [Piptocephalis tieghemiana]|nr:MAG: hypothetical protein DHS80DRAFT_22837 [Piptocephalis tieghemiana]